MLELRDRQKAGQWLAAGLCTMRLGKPDDGRLVVAIPWLIDALSEQGSLPPPGFVTDLGRLLSGASLRSAAPIPQLPERLRRALRSYEDHVLGRLEGSPRLEELCDAFLALPEVQQSKAVAVLTARLLARVEWDRGVSLSPGLVRQIVGAPVAETVHSGLEVLGEPGEITMALAEGYEELAARSRRAGSLLDETDVFLVENIAILGDLTHRLAIAQVSEVAGQLISSLPRRLKPRRAQLRQKVATQLEDDDQYPTGGFSSISTAGSLENLVISELIYMDDGAGENVDLFDLRYAEGELLYYTRDEAVYTRGHRFIELVLDPNLTRCRVKDPGQRWQRIILMLGLLGCLVDRLAAWLEAEALEIRINLLVSGRRAELAEEEKLLSLFLREWIERDLVQVARVSSMDEVFERVGEQMRVGECDVIRISADEGEPPVLFKGVQTAHLALGSAVPKVRWAHRGEPTDTSEEAEAASFAPWPVTALALLQELV